MIMPITILEMQRLHCACKRVLGAEEWERRVEIAWESLRDLEVVTADMLESAIMDGFGAAGVHFDHKEAQKLSELADYCVVRPARSACARSWHQFNVAHRQPMGSVKPTRHGLIAALPNLGHRDRTKPSNRGNQPPETRNARRARSSARKETEQHEHSRQNPRTNQGRTGASWRVFGL